MGKAHEQATIRFQGQLKFTTIGIGLAKSIVQDTYNKIECCHFKNHITGYILMWGNVQEAVKEIRQAPNYEY